MTVVRVATLHEGGVLTWSTLATFSVVDGAIVAEWTSDRFRKSIESGLVYVAGRSWLPSDDGFLDALAKQFSCSSLVSVESI